MERALDSAFVVALEEELAALASTEMETAALATILATDVQPVDWQIGEALAECLLEAWHEAVWVWNGSRDRRTAKASLPGADLVGFVKSTGRDARLLFGEVKSSSDKRTPPGVLHGRSGMIAQLERLSQSTDHGVLIKWLRARCGDEVAVTLFREAVRTYLRGGQRELLLVGCLMRDTQPNEADLRPRAEALAALVLSPMEAELRAWYVPQQMSTWQDLVIADA